MAETLDIVYFVALVGVLIFVHELGHFAWAKFFGVKVLTFSLGFGPRLLGFHRKGTEYVVAAFPLGGYVKMLGENPHDVVSEEDEGRAFHHQALWKRVVIVFAGPAMNLLFPLLLFFVVHLGDEAVQPSVVGVVFPERPAAAALQPGDRIVALNEEPVGTFEEVMRIVGAHADRPVDFRVERRGEVVERTITPVLTRTLREPKELELYEEVGRVGIGPMHPTAVVGVIPGGAAAAARPRMKTFDVVVAASGQRVDRFLDLERVLEQNSGTTTQITYLRPSRLARALGGLVEIDVLEPHVAQVTPSFGDGEGAVRAGLEQADLYVSHVMVDSPEHRELQILPGDRLVSLDGRPIRTFQSFLRDLNAGRGQEHILRWQRGEQILERRYRLRHVRGETEWGQPYERFEVGIRNWVPAVYNPPVPPPRPVWRALVRSIETTVELVEVTVLSVVRLLEGRLSYKTIGGPISIFQVTGVTRREGSLDFLRLMGLVSVNLGLINLLPIPVLDGGHLAIFAYESVSRRRLSVRSKQIAAVTGLLVLVVLMVLAFKNDIERTWASAPVELAE